MKLYNKICQALDENEIDEIGLLHLLPNVKELPSESEKYYPLVVVENKIGIDLSILCLLLKESHEYFITINKENIKEIEMVTRVMILLKPDNYTAMNRRKELLSNGYIKPKEELKLIELIFTLSKHCKSSTAWYHREWIIKNYKKEISFNLRKELEISLKAISLYSRNYYGWNYRYLILKENYNLNIEILKEEYDKICYWITFNITDFTGIQYLQQIIKLIPEFQYKIHLNWLNNLILKYPGNESLWCHRRFCSSEFHIYPNYNLNQHEFILNILNNKFKDQSLSNNSIDILNQKELALKFGLWQLLLEKRFNYPINQDYLNLYTKINPIPNLFK